jgi:hypothetical protein
MLAPLILDRDQESPINHVSTSQETTATVEEVDVELRLWKAAPSEQYPSQRLTRRPRVLTDQFQRSPQIRAAPPTSERDHVRQLLDGR